jgi:D-lyxose ketol-isomerase
MMKRSEINHSIMAAKDFFSERNLTLPFWAHWSPEEWTNHENDMSEVMELGLGWDVTDFGSGDLSKIGRTIFTLRNGRGNQQHPKNYAHKIMHMPEGQKSIIHYHRSKMEDICNRGGGNILVSLWPVTEDGSPSNESIISSLSGQKIEVKGGEPVRITPGNWICIEPYTYHQFWAEGGEGEVLSEEISSVCNDHTDNVFWPEGERFPAINEDDTPLHLLCGEYHGF